MDDVQSDLRAQIPPLEKGGLGGDRFCDLHPKISAKFSTSPLQGEVNSAPDLMCISSSPVYGGSTGEAGDGGLRWS